MNIKETDSNYKTVIDLKLKYTGTKMAQERVKGRDEPSGFTMVRN